MTRNDLSHDVADATGLDLRTSHLAVDTMIESLSRSFVKGEDVYIRGFGTLEVKTTAPKQARDISRNQFITVPSRKVIKFKISKALLNRINS